MTKPLLRHSFDLGTNSIGWAVYELRTVPETDKLTVSRLVNCGVRIFDDSRNPKDKRSLAEQRRGPRAMRRRRDRYLLRRRKLMALLIDIGLMPAESEKRKVLAQLDPYCLRAKALDQVLSAHELGRALFHLNQRRGFRSNRKTDKRKDSDKGKIATASARLQQQLAEQDVRTYGEFLWRRHGGKDGTATPRHPDRLPVRIRLHGTGAKALYDFYPLRAMLEDEFRLIVKRQAVQHPHILTAENVEILHNAIFRQRDLRPVKKGKCTLEPTEERLAKALPSVEARVIYETLNHLKYGEGLTADTSLTKAQRDEFAAQLLQGKNVTFKSMKSKLGLSAQTVFNLENQGKDDLKDFVSKSARGLSHKECFGARWHDLPLEAKDRIVEKLIGEATDADVHAWLMAEHYLQEDAAEAALEWSPPEGATRLGATANREVLAELILNVCTYDKAIESAGKRLGRPWHHSDFRDGEILLPLPYYGRILERQVAFGSSEPTDEDEVRYGRVNNPTVHRALNQLRRIINRLVKTYGEPQEIVIELARDLKQSEQRKDEEKKSNLANRQDNDKRRDKLAALTPPRDDTYENRLRLRLYEEQQRANNGFALCPYSLREIGIATLFSEHVEIDHILPYSKTFDDSPANKVVCYRESNRTKRTLAPHHWKQNDSRWPEIAANAAGLPANKRWRFAADAMERYQNAERDFMARQLNETRYISKLARTYLGAVCGFDNVYVTTGQLTAMLRARWGLNGILSDANRKIRTDHRHHAIDAIVVGAIDRRLLNEMAKRAARAEEENRDRITADVPDPYDRFLDDARVKVLAVVVSPKPDHGKQGALHEETAYGLIRDDKERAEIGNLVYRKQLTDLSVNDIDRVRDPLLRRQLQDLAAPFRDDKGKLAGKEEEKQLATALATFSVEQVAGRMQGVRRVRIGKEKTGEVQIRDRRTNEVYKALLPGDNHHIDIVEMRDGSWQGFAATLFEVNQKDWRPRWERDKLGGKLVMRLHKGDTIEVEHDGRRKIMVVHRLKPSSNQIFLAEHKEGGELEKRHEKKLEQYAGDPFRWDMATIGLLKARGARKVLIDEIGRVRYERSNVG